MAYAWTQAFGKLPPLYWSRYFRREKYFDDCGKFIDPKKVHFDLKNRMKQMWDLFSKYFGASQKVPADCTTQICDSVLSSFSHHSPKMGFSIVEDQTQRQLVITPELHNQTKARSLGLASPASHQSKSGSAALKRVEQLIFHSSDMGSPHVTINGSKSAAGEQPTSISVHGPSKEHPIAPKPPNHSTQLPPSITDLYTLLLQLFDYEPSKRLPALLISRHPWFGDATLVGDESREFESAENEEESEGLKMGLRTQNSMDKAVGSSKKGEVAMWSVVLDMELGTWKYVRSVEVGRASGGHKAD
ncbi:hypothetical protein B0J14DRAFT_678050 [Halenospora varia]|nr:hypothetical protein B0J14DRAFT_678050 [Halenospora varia]